LAYTKLAAMVSHAATRHKNPALQKSKTNHSAGSTHASINFDRRFGGADSDDAYVHRYRFCG
jgi:hypothetical protein